MNVRNLVAAVLLFAVPHIGYAETLEMQSNPVDQGAISVADGDADRSDWEGIPWYEFDDDNFVEFYPVDLDRIQIAHDKTHVYFHLETLEWDVEENWRAGTYIDADADPLTGYTGDFLPLGADFLLEDTIFEFTGASQAEWGWAGAGEIVRDQSTRRDVEVAVPRATLGNPTQFDLIVFANNTCCDFQMPDDIYPSEAGFVLTYELGENIITAGDFNADGSIDSMDIDALSIDIAQMSNTPLYDLTNDNMTTLADIEAWLGINETLNGDADLSGDVAFSDFLILSGAFGQAANWTGGDFDGNGTAEFPDFLILSGNFGKSGTAVAAVPEPTATLPVLLGIFCLAITARQKRLSGR